MTTPTNHRTFENPGEIRTIGAHVANIISDDQIIWCVEKIPLARKYNWFGQPDELHSLKKSFRAFLTSDQMYWAHRHGWYCDVGVMHLEHFICAKMILMNPNVLNSTPRSLSSDDSELQEKYNQFVQSMKDQAEKYVKELEELAQQQPLNTDNTQTEKEKAFAGHIIELFLDCERCKGRVCNQLSQERLHFVQALTKNAIIQSQRVEAYNTHCVKLKTILHSESAPEQGEDSWWV